MGIEHSYTNSNDVNLWSGRNPFKSTTDYGTKNVLNMLVLKQFYMQFCDKYL